MTENKIIPKLKDPVNEFLSDLFAEMPIGKDFDFETVVDTVIAKDKFLHDSNGYYLDKQIIFKELGTGEMIKELFENSGYIEKSINKYKLTERGILAKDLGGHNQFIIFRTKELKAQQADQNAKIYYIPIIITLLGIIISTSISVRSCYKSQKQTDCINKSIIKLDSQQSHISVVQQSLQSQVDSISNLLLSKPVDTTGKN